MSMQILAPKMLGAPGTYIQGRRVLSRLGEYAAQMGHNPLLLADPLIWPLFEEEVTASLSVQLDRHELVLFQGECCHKEIERVTKAAKAAGCDLVVALGGGKALDTAKAVTLNQELPLIIVPTIASNDAPTSRLVVVYSDDGELIEVLKLPSNPRVVLVDTQVIAAAPARFLVAGMGDALPTKFEAEQSHATKHPNLLGGRPTHTALMLAHTSYQLVRGYGLAAKQAVEQNLVTEAVELVVEANVLLSGLGFESGGLAAAHALTRGFSAMPEMHRSLHGEEVAFGLLVQFMLENRTNDFMRDIMGFYGQVGLPVTLAELGLQEPSAEHYRIMAAKCMYQGSHIYKMTQPVDELLLCDALQATHQLGLAFRQEADLG